MTLALEELDPADEAVFSELGDLTFEVSGIDTGLDTRSLYISIGDTTIYQNINTVITSEPGWSALTTYPASDRIRVVITPPGGDPDPTLYNGSIYVEQGEPTETFSKSFSWLLSSVTPFAAQPSADQQEVSPLSSVSLSVRTAAVINSVTVFINEVQAVASMTSSSPTWSNPDFEGSVLAQENQHTLLIRHRRAFDPGSKVTVRYVAAISPDFESEFEVEGTYSFFVAERRSFLLDSTLRDTALDRPISECPACETFRMTLLGALRLPTSRAAAEVLLYYRVVRSSLRTLAARLVGRSLDVELAGLVPEDLATPMAVDAALAALDILWAPALHEATRLGIPQDLQTLLDRAHQAPYPQDRVASVAALLLAVTHAG